MCTVGSTRYVIWPPEIVAGVSPSSSKRSPDAARCAGFSWSSLAVCGAPRFGVLPRSLPQSVVRVCPRYAFSRNLGSIDRKSKYDRRFALGFVYETRYKAARIIKHFLLLNKFPFFFQ